MLPSFYWRCVPSPRTHVMVMTRSTVLPSRDDNADAVGAGPATGGEGSAQQGKGKGKAAAAAQKEQKIVYPKPEDNALHQLASWSHLWPAAVPEATAASDAQSKLTQMRLVCNRTCSPAASRRHGDVITGTSFAHTLNWDCVNRSGDAGRRKRCGRDCQDHAGDC